MLKIKDNVDLELIEQKYKLQRDCWNDLNNYDLTDNFYLVHINNKTRIIYLDTSLEETTHQFDYGFELLYELIKDGLVEKVC